MRRRDILKSALAAPALAALNIVAAETEAGAEICPAGGPRHACDPVWTTADVTRDHARLVPEGIPQLYRARRVA
jgi:hypothetical protein